MDRATLISQIEEGMKRAGEYARLDGETLGRAYAPGKWTGAEVLAHIADADLVLLYRIEKTIAEPGSPMVPFDQDRWVEGLESGRRSPGVSAKLIEATRSAVVELIRTLPDEAWSRSGVHAERGSMTAEDVAGMMARHGLHHCDQLEAIRRGEEWRGAPL